MLAERSRTDISRKWWCDDEVIVMERLYRHHVDFSNKQYGALIFLVVLPPAGCGDCGSGCAEGRSDAGPGGGCEDAAGLGGDCCCDSSEHGENVFVCRGMIRAVAVD